MTRISSPPTRRAAAGLLVGLLAGLSLATPALGADPLAAGQEVRRVVLEEITPYAEWQVGGDAVAFGRTEIRRIGEFAHVRTVLTRADGGSFDPEAIVGISWAARPLTISGVLRQRAGRWLLLATEVEPADTRDPDAHFRRWALPAGLLPPDCGHRQNWGCGGPAP